MYTVYVYYIYIYIWLFVSCVTISVPNAGELSQKHAKCWIWERPHKYNIKYYRKLKTWLIYISHLNWNIVESGVKHHKPISHFIGFHKFILDLPQINQANRKQLSIESNGFSFCCCSSVSTPSLLALKDWIIPERFLIIVKTPITIKYIGIYLWTGHWWM